MLRRLIHALSVRLPATPARFYASAVEPLRAMLAAYIDGAMLDGRLKTTDPGEAADVLLTNCYGRSFRLAEYGRFEIPADDVEADARVAVRVFLAAYS